MVPPAIKDNACIKAIADTGKKLYFLFIGEDSCPFLVGLATGTVVALVLDRKNGKMTKADRQAKKAKRQLAIARMKKCAADLPKKMACTVSIGISKLKRLKKVIAEYIKKFMLKRRGLLYDSYPNVTCKVTRKEDGNIRADTITLPDKFVRQLLGEKEIKEVLHAVEKAKAEKKGKKKAKDFCLFTPTTDKAEVLPKPNDQDNRKIKQLKEDSEENNKGGPDKSGKSGEAFWDHAGNKKEQRSKDKPSHHKDQSDGGNKGDKDKSDSGYKSGKGQGAKNITDNEEEDKSREKRSLKDEDKGGVERTNVDGQEYVCIPEGKVGENPDEEAVRESIKKEKEKEDEDEQELKFMRKSQLDKEN